MNEAGRGPFPGKCPGCHAAIEGRPASCPRCGHAFGSSSPVDVAAFVWPENVGNRSAPRSLDTRAFGSLGNKPAAPRAGMRWSDDDFARLSQLARPADTSAAPQADPVSAEAPEAGNEPVSAAMEPVADEPDFAEAVVPTDEPAVEILLPVETAAVPEAEAVAEREPLPLAPQLPMAEPAAEHEADIRLAAPEEGLDLLELDPEPLPLAPQLLFADEPLEPMPAEPEPVPVAAIDAAEPAEAVLPPMAAAAIVADPAFALPRLPTLRPHLRRAQAMRRLAYRRMSRAGREGMRQAHREMRKMRAGTVAVVTRGRTSADAVLRRVDGQAVTRLSAPAAAVLLGVVAFSYAISTPDRPSPQVNFTPPAETRNRLASDEMGGDGRVAEATLPVPADSATASAAPVPPVPMPRVERHERMNGRAARTRSSHRTSVAEAEPHFTLPPLFDDPTARRLRPAGPGHVLPTAASTRGRAIRMPDDPSEIQLKLKRLGYYEGPLTGRYDVPTQRAVILFQIDHGLPRNGRIDAELVDSLQNALHRQRLANAGR